MHALVLTWHCISTTAVNHVKLGNYLRSVRLDLDHNASRDEKVGQRRKSGTKKGKVYLGHFLEFEWTKTIKKYIERYSSI